MIKKLIFTATLLAPALAYGQNPSGDLSVQVVPASGPPNGIACDIGPNYTGSIPAGAQAAGFTHCAANYDFSSTTYANPATYINCKGAASPQWWCRQSGALQEASQVNIVTDGGQGQVLNLHFTNGQISNNQGYGTTLVTSSDEQRGPGQYFPLNMYLEFKVRVIPAPANWTPSNKYADIWAIDWSNAATEFDFTEFYTYKSPGSDVAGGSSMHGSPYDAGYTASSSLDPTQYHVYAERLTSDGSTGMGVCYYVDQALQSCGPLGAANPSQFNNRPYLNIGGMGDAGITSTTGSGDMYMVWMHVFSCSNWATQECNRSILTSAP